MKYWEIIAGKLSKGGWSWGCVSAIDLSGKYRRTYKRLQLFAVSRHQREEPSMSGRPVTGRLA